ncbi:MAG: TetR/AcrR family transcriptional regulator [Kiritimatiellia bacterium]|jgi:AcrR family transcriptional regulator
MASSNREEEKTLPTYWQILDAARELFAKNGFRDTTIRMISKKARVNGASVNYYFRSKAALYETIFQEAFEKVGKPMTGLASTVVDQKTWEAALDAWVTFMLTLFLKEEPEFSIVRQLVARERSMPTQYCNDLFAEYSHPVINAFRNLIHMAMPDAPEEELQCVFVSYLGQCTCFLNRDPPWDKVVICQSIPRNRWIQMMRRQIMSNITSRLSFKRNTLF